MAESRHTVGESHVTPQKLPWPRCAYLGWRAWRGRQRAKRRRAGGAQGRHRIRAAERDRLGRRLPGAHARCRDRLLLLLLLGVAVAACTRGLCEIQLPLHRRLRWAAELQPGRVAEGRRRGATPKPRRGCKRKAARLVAGARRAAVPPGHRRCGCRCLCGCCRCCCTTGGRRGGREHRGRGRRRRQWRRARGRGAMPAGHGLLLRCCCLSRCWRSGGLLQAARHHHVTRSAAGGPTGIPGHLHVKSPTLPNAE